MTSLTEWKSAGVSFTLRDDGRFQVHPSPLPGSELFSFCQRFRDEIAFDLWAQSQGLQLARPQHDMLDLARKLFPGSEEFPLSTWRDAAERFTAFCDEQGHDLETRLAALARVIALFHGQGLPVQEWMAIQAFNQIAKTP